MAPPYDPHDSPTRERGHRYVDERRDYREPRYDEGRESYLKPFPTSRDLVPRHREDSDLSIEEIHRDFPVPDSYRDIRRARSAGPYDYDSRSRGYDREYRDRRGGESSLYYEKEREKSRRRVLSQKEKILAAVAGAALAVGSKEVFDHRKAKEEGHDVERNYLQSGALAAAGALAVYGGAGLYNKHAGKEEKKHTYIVHRGRDGRVSEYYSDDSDDATAKKGKKSFLESALGVTSLGAAFKAITGDDRSDRDRHSGRGGRRSRSSSSSRSRGSRSGGNRSKMQKAAMASLLAGATEAFRVAKEPGGWKGEKAKRVVTAALGAGTIDAAHDRDKDTKLGLAESVIGGLLSNRLVHGSRKDIYEDKKGRSRSKSRTRSASRGRVAALATALGAKALKSRADSRGRDSDGSRSPREHRARSRSRSVVDSARKSLAKLVGGGQESDRHRGRDYDSDDDHRRGGHRHREYDEEGDYEDDYRSSNRGGGRDDEYDNRSSHRSRRKGKSNAGSESDLGDSSEDEKRAKKMKGKQLLTTGLAAVATIHAAHEVYQSMEKRNARQKAVKEGRLSPEEAKKLKAKALLQDAASVGIAALGIKGAVSELKEARHMSEECKEFRHERALRQKKRRERQRKLLGVGGRSRADNWSTSAPPRPDRYEYGTRYTDGNPYSAALPAPPVGYDRR